MGATGNTVTHGVPTTNTGGVRTRFQRGPQARLGRAKTHVPNMHGHFTCVYGKPWSTPSSTRLSAPKGEDMGKPREERGCRKKSIWRRTRMKVRT